MRNHKVKIGKEKFEINIPHSYEEITWDQYKKLKPELSDIELSEILTGKSFIGFWDKFQDVDEWNLIKLHCLMAVQESINLENYPMYDILTYQGKDCIVPKDLGSKSVARFEEAKLYANQYIELNKNIEKENEISLEKFKVEHKVKLMEEHEAKEFVKNNYVPETIPANLLNDTIESIFKNYFYELFTGEEFDSTKAQEMNIDELYCLDVLKFGNFFLQNIIASLLGITRKWLNLSLPLKNRRRGFLRYLVGLGFIQSYGAWQRR